MKTNYQLVATGIAAALAVGVALGLLLHHLKRLIKTSWLYDRVWTFWSLHFNRPVCQVHGPWHKTDLPWGFCGRCLDDHLEGRLFECLQDGGDVDWRLPWSQS